MNLRCPSATSSVSATSGTSTTSEMGIEARLFVALLRTADSLSLEAEKLFKEFELTDAQYNVLRILRGAEPTGLACREIGDRMVSHDPDITRLLDRMEKREMIVRQRQTDDRRVIKTRVTPAGLRILRKLDQPIRELHKDQFRHMSAKELKLLGALLESVLGRQRVSGV